MTKYVLYDHNEEIVSVSFELTDKNSIDAIEKAIAWSNDEDDTYYALLQVTKDWDTESKVGEFMANLVASKAKFFEAEAEKKRLAAEKKKARDKALYEKLKKEFGE